MAAPAFTTSNSPAPAEFAEAVTPSDSTSLSKPARALYVGTTGNLSLLMADGTSVTFSSVPVGVLPVRCIRVNSTGTTASNIVALY